MSPEQLAQFNNMMERMQKLERAENVAFIKSVERNTSFITQADLDSQLAALTLDDLSNVEVPSPSNGQVLKYTTSGTPRWIAGTDNT